MSNVDFPTDLWVAFGKACEQMTANERLYQQLDEARAEAKALRRDLVEVRTEYIALNKEKCRLERLVESYMTIIARLQRERNQALMGSGRRKKG